MAQLKSDIHLANLFQKINEDMRAGRIINAHEWLVKLREYVYAEYGEKK